MFNIELLIQNGSIIYQPVVTDGVTWETWRSSSPGKLTFDVVKDGIINFQEGNPVMLKVNKKNVFYGFVFSKKRTKDEIISVVAYDQLRYLKNKDTYVYSNKTASDFIKMLAGDFNLNIGDIEETGYVISSRVEDNKELFDMINNSLDLTLNNKKKLFVLYDDFGKLTLKNIESMKLDLIIDGGTAEDYGYTSTIDGDTYNKIKLAYENDQSGKREIFIAQDSTNINNWGVLQFFETIQDGETGKMKADALLTLYNRKTRTLNVQNALGDVRVRGGSSLIVNLNLGDIVVRNYMIVESVKHMFKNEEHLMNLSLKGGGFIA